MDKAKRGRPLLGDMPYLEQVADLLVQDKSLAVTAAMNRIIRTPGAKWYAEETSVRRRWLRKWVVEADQLLAAAKLRLEGSRQLAHPLGTSRKQLTDGLAAVAANLRSQSVFASIPPEVAEQIRASLIETKIFASLGSDLKRLETLDRSVFKALPKFLL